MAPIAQEVDVWVLDEWHTLLRYPDGTLTVLDEHDRGEPHGPEEDSPCQSIAKNTARNGPSSTTKAKVTGPTPRKRAPSNRSRRSTFLRAWPQASHPAKRSLDTILCPVVPFM